MRSTGKGLNLLLLLGALLGIVLCEAEEWQRIPFFVSDYFIRNGLNNWNLSEESLRTKQSARQLSRKKEGLLLHLTRRELEGILQPREGLSLVPSQVNVLLENGKTRAAQSVDLPSRQSLQVRTETAVSNIMKVSAKYSLRKHQVMQAVRFIEEEFCLSVSSGNYYCPKEVTGLMGGLEYDPATGYYFIHLDYLVGQGCCKIVTLSILYGVKFPEMVAMTVPREGIAMNEEVAILRRVQSVDGVLRLISDPMGGRHKMITTLYEGGTLAEAGRKIHLSAREIALFAKDLLGVLKGVHQSGVVHLDIHPGNLLLEKREGEQRRLILIDWGIARVINENNSYDVQSDLYSAAVVFCSLLNPTIPLGIFQQKLAMFKKLGEQVGEAMPSGSLLLGEISHELTERKSWLDEAYALRSLSFEEGFERILLHMLHPVQGECHDALYWSLALESLWGDVPALK
ncbi:protein kinase domain-containing protein [Estrella lausannensis]|uniref:Putative serine/threonine protein kinase n=1 Tax=Estrella lausannensis TaxID=483423 RepID=A0A0H5E612_9BACT|nr:AarF/UbiB family protein [Estrella lausannensis]CRX38685.1 Putative serine/threonine protein kinase [Estrella lausannensis]